ncbi:MAG: hypothetical protein ACT4PW_11130 [Acidimicrobiia bacterium]
MHRRIGVLLVSLSLIVMAGCGDDEGGGQSGAYVDALTSDLLKDDDDGPQLTSSEGRCLAEAAVTALGADRLDEAGVTPEQLAAVSDLSDIALDYDRDQLAGAFEDAFEECNLLGPLTTQLVSEELTSEFELDADQQRCVADELAKNAEFVRTTAESFAGAINDEEGAEAFGRVIEAVFTTCNVEGGGSDEQAAPYVEALAAFLQEDSSPPNYTSTQAECFAEKAVDAVGVDTLERASVTPEAFAQADPLSELDLDVDDDELVGDLATAFKDCELLQGVAELFVSDGSVPAEARECVVGEVAGNDDLARAAAQGIVGTIDDAEAERAFARVLADALLACNVANTSGDAGLLQGDLAACVAGQLGIEPAELDALAAGMEDAAFTGLLTDALVACPQQYADLIIASIPAEALTPALEACFRQLLLDRIQEGAAVIANVAAGGDQQQAVDFGIEIGTACAQAN